MTGLPRIVREADIEAAAGARVEVCGVYTPCHLGRRPRPSGAPVHVAIELADGARVLLEPPWHPAARRSADERAAHDGRPVRVVGTLLATVPEEVEGAATPRVPCLVAIESISADDTP